MSSCQTHIAQMNKRSQYLIALDQIIVNRATTNTGSFINVKSVITASEVQQIFTSGVVLPGGTFLKDMGKSYTVIDDTTKQQLFIYRLMQIQVDTINASEGSEGALYYVPVWFSNGDNTNIVRTG